MQMHDTLRQAQGASIGEALAAAFAIPLANAQAVIRAVMRELTWHLQRNTLSLGGLADLVEALGGGHHMAYLSRPDIFRDETVRADGNAILGHILGSEARSRTVATRAARQTGVDDRLIRSMLPGLAAVAMGTLALRAKTGLADILAQVPPLGRAGRGDPHADLAGILRRGCGAGRYGPLVLRRRVRRALLRAAGAPSGGVVGWYLGFLFAHSGARMVRAVQARTAAERS